MAAKRHLPCKKWHGKGKFKGLRPVFPRFPRFQAIQALFRPDSPDFRTGVTGARCPDARAPENRSKREKSRHMALQLVNRQSQNAKLVLQPRVDALNRGPVDVADRLRGDVHGRPRLRFHSLISLAPCRGGD